MSRTLKPRKVAEIRFRAHPLDEKRLAALARLYELTVSATLRRLILDGWGAERKRGAL